MVGSSERRIATNDLRGVCSTGLFTLYWRAVESDRPGGMFRDPVAQRILHQLQCDTSSFDRDRLLQVGVAVRTEILDEVASSFLRTHPDALVVNLGAGFCTRFFRVDNGRVHWVEVDLPSVIALRRRVLPEGPRCRYLESSILEPDWMGRVEWTPGRPLLIIAEGILQYFSRRDVKNLLVGLSEHFVGADMLLEALSPLAMALSGCQRSLWKSGVRARWCLADVMSLERWTPRIRVMGRWNYDRHPERWGWLRALGWVPGVRTLMKIVHLKFVPPSGAA